MQPASQPSLFSHTHSFTAQLAQPREQPHTHIPSQHQHWHCKASIATQTLLTLDDQPTPVVHLSIPPLRRHRKQLHCPAHSCTLGNAATLSCNGPKAVHECHRLLAHVPARLNRKRHKPESSMIRHILPEPRPLGLFRPCRSPSSCLGSLSSVRLRICMRNHDIHCRKLELRQHRQDVPPALAFDHALLAGQGPVPRFRRRLAAAGRHDQAQGVCQVIVAHLGHLGYLLAGHRMICFSSNSCTAFARRGGHVSGNVAPQAVPHRHNEHVVAASVMRPPGMAVRKAPASPPDELRSLAASRCPWVVLRSKLGSMSAWHASSPFLVTSWCAPSGPFLLSRNSVGRSFAAASHVHCSAYRAWRLLAEGKAQLAAPSGRP